MGYKEIYFAYCWNIERAVEELYERAKDGNKYCGDFNRNKLTSDMSLDDAYMLCTGKTFDEFNKEREESRRRLIQEDEEYKKKIPELSKYWIEEGHKVLSKDKWEMWDKCVSIRLRDLYMGMELGQCLDIIKTVKEKSIQDGIEIMKNQGHSGMSWGLMKSMIREFCDCGNEFLNQLGE